MTAIYKDANRPVAERVADLLARTNLGTDAYKN